MHQCYNKQINTRVCSTTVETYQMIFKLDTQLKQIIFLLGPFAMKCEVAFGFLLAEMSLTITVSSKVAS